MKVNALVSAALVSAVLGLSGTAFAQAPATTPSAIVAGPMAAPAAATPAPAVKAETTKVGAAKAVASADTHAKVKPAKKHSKGEAGQPVAAKATPAS